MRLSNARPSKRVIPAGPEEVRVLSVLDEEFCADSEPVFCTK